MYIDKELEFSEEQAVTSSAASTNYIDLGAARDLGVSEGLHVHIHVDEAATASGAATVDFELQVDDNSSFSSAKTVASSGAIGKATLVADHALYLPVPLGADEQYMRLYYTVATGPLTAGKFTASVVKDIQKYKSYPDAL